MIVLGAGMAGLLAASVLRSDCKLVVEAQKQIPNNHSAVLRFRTHAVADALNIPFRQARVMKAVHECINPIADSLMYSRKTTGFSTLRSIVTANGQLDTRYIAPEDFISQMVARVQAPFEFDSIINNLADIVDLQNRFSAKAPVISTMPMPVLMTILGWQPKSEFRTVTGYNINSKLTNIDAYFSLYVPDPSFPFSRISVTGDLLCVECPDPFGELTPDVLQQKMALDRALEHCGLPHSSVTNPIIKRQRFAKILPYDDQDRKAFILWATREHNIYSLGRFSTWRPGLLLDDVVNDIRVIHRLAGGKSSYDYQKG